MGRRSDVLHVLKAAAEPLTIAHIAEALDVHPNTVRFHLDAMVSGGQVERLNSERRTPGRPPLLFQAVARMDPDGPRDYRALAEMLALGLAQQPDTNDRAAAAGRVWAERYLAGTGRVPAPDEAIAHLVGLMEELNFAPTILPSADLPGPDLPGPGVSRPDADIHPEAPGGAAEVRIGMRHCPFLELAGELEDVVCPAHLGLMRGALDAWQSGIMVDRLIPFAEADICVAHLRPADRHEASRRSVIGPVG